MSKLANLTQPSTHGVDRSAPRIVSIETIRPAVQPNLTLVAITSDDGLVGLGETFYGASTVETYLHDVAAPLLLGAGSMAPVDVARLLSGYVGYSGSGAETRGNSAIDIALWDLLAQRAGLPLRDILGGPVRASIPVYNTCAGNRYVSTDSRQSSSNWGVGAGGADALHEDLWAFLNQPARLAKELVDAGFPGMKVWPFDLAAEASGGDHRTDLREGLEVLDAIRESVGNDIELYLELHSLWTLPGATRLFRELERFDLTWAEDPIRADRTQALARLSAETRVPLAVGENVGAGANAYRPLLEQGSIDVAIIDLGWSGGISTGLKVAALAESHGVPIAPHDCTGPVSLATAVHFVTAVENGFVQEFARSFYYGWYRDLVEGLPELTDGQIAPAATPGHGVRLREEALIGATRRITTLE